MAFQFGPKNTAITTKPAQEQVGGGENKSGHKHFKAKVQYNASNKNGPARSNALKGLKTAAQANNAPATANSNPPGSNGFPNNSWS